MLKLFKKTVLRPISKKEIQTRIYKEVMTDEEIGSYFKENTKSLDSKKIKFGSKDSLDHILDTSVELKQEKDIMHKQLKPDENSIIGRKSYSRLETLYQEALNRAEKWEKLAGRYYNEKKFLEDKLLNRFNKKKSNIITGTIISYLKFLKMPGIISILLLVNFVFLVFIAKNMRENGELHFFSSKQNKSREVFPYAIQVGVFQKYNLAQAITKRLQKKGFEAKINKPADSKSDFYRVYVGNYKNVSEAEKTLKGIKKIFGLNKAFIRKRF